MGKGGKAHATLTGRIFDGDGKLMTPTFAYGRSGRLYRYYVSAALQQGGARNAHDTSPRRVSAPFFEAHLSARLLALLPSAPDQPLDLVSKVEIYPTHIVVFLPVRLQRRAELSLVPGETCTPDTADPTRLCLTLPFRVSTRRGKTEIIDGPKAGPCPHAALIGALRSAHALAGSNSSGAAKIPSAPTSSYQRRLIQLAFLAPDIQEAILAGQQPSCLNLSDLMDHGLPILWSEQRKALGWRSFN